MDVAAETAAGGKAATTRGGDTRPVRRSSICACSSSGSAAFQSLPQGTMETITGTRTTPWSLRGISRPTICTMPPLSPTASSQSTRSNSRLPKCRRAASAVEEIRRRQPLDISERHAEAEQSRAHQAFVAIGLELHLVEQALAQLRQFVLVEGLGDGARIARCQRGQIFFRGTTLRGAAHGAGAVGIAVLCRAHGLNGHAICSGQYDKQDPGSRHHGEPVLKHERCRATDFTNCEAGRCGRLYPWRSLVKSPLKVCARLDWPRPDNTQRWRRS